MIDRDAAIEALRAVAHELFACSGPHVELGEAIDAIADLAPADPIADLRAALTRIANMTSRAPHRSLPIYAVAVDALHANDPIGADYFSCGRCGDRLLPEDIEGHMASEGRALAAESDTPERPACAKRIDWKRDVVIDEGDEAP